VSRLAVVGTGVIGAGWAALFLARGHDVTAWDPAVGAEAGLRGEVEAMWPVLTRLGLAEGASPDRLTFATSVAEAVAEAEVVQESGPERLEPKQALVAEIDAAAPADAIIASSSSGQKPSDLQARCGRHPERVLVGHPFSPAHLIPLVEVVPGRRTDPDVADRALGFYRSLGKRPILVRQELPGHVTNRLQVALWREAYALVQRGAATVADIDAAIANGPGLRWALLGPLMNQHLGGGAGGMAHVLEHLGPPAEAWMDDLSPTPHLTPELVRLLVDGVDAELAGMAGMAGTAGPEGLDQAALVRARDELLVELLERKRDHGLG